MRETKTRNVRSVSSKIFFPSWKSLLMNTIIEMADKFNTHDEKYTDSISKIIRKLSIVQRNVHTNPPLIAMQVLMDASGEYIPTLNIREIMKKVNDITIGINEFYSIYDLKKGKFIAVDSKVKDILGIDPDRFTIQALFGMEPQNKLFHPEDVDHIARWAGIAYIVLAFPGFSFKAIHDHYKVNFRISTEGSQQENLKALNDIMLEKRCYLVYDDRQPLSNEPSFHFDRWTVYDSSQFEYVSPVFVTNFQQGSYMNALAYLLNAFLLDVPVKYIAILDEKRHSNRNKAIANKLNQNMLRYAPSIAYSFDEYQVGDCFAKSIRPKMAEVMKLWDRNADDITVLSDQEALHCAKKLGLIPMPTIVKQMLYKNIFD